MLDIHTRVNNKRCIKTGNVRYTHTLPVYILTLPVYSNITCVYSYITCFDTSLVVNPCVYILTLPVYSNITCINVRIYTQGLTKNKRCIKTGNVRIYTQGLTTRDVSKQVMLEYTHKG
jgi:hypothetical protein